MPNKSDSSHSKVMLKSCICESYDQSFSFSFLKVVLYPKTIKPILLGLFEVGPVKVCPSGSGLMAQDSGLPQQEYDCNCAKNVSTVSRR